MIASLGQLFRRRPDGQTERRKAKRTAIGLHMQSGLLTAAQLDFAPDGPKLRALAECTVAAGAAEEDIAEALVGMIDAHPFLGRRVVSVVGVHVLSVQSIRVPLVDGEDLQTIVRSEAAERLRIPAGSAEVRYLPVAEVRHEENVRQEILLLACPTAIIEREQRILRAARLSPAAIDLEPAAVMRSLRPEPQDASVQDSADATAQCGIISLSRESLTLTLVESGRILFVKHLADGGLALDRAIAQAMDFAIREASRLRNSVAHCEQLDQNDDVHRALADALDRPLDMMVRELELCLRYHKITFRRPLASLTLTGCDAAGWIAAFLGQRLGVACTLGALGTPAGPILGLPGEGQRMQPTRWMTAIGAALRPRVANHVGLKAGDVTDREATLVPGGHA